MVGAAQPREVLHVLENLLLLRNPDTFPKKREKWQHPQRKSVGATRVK